MVAKQDSEIQCVSFLHGHLVYSTSGGVLVVQNFRENFIKTFSTGKQFNFILLQPKEAKEEQSLAVTLYCVVNRQRVILMDPNLPTPILLEEEAPAQVVSFALFSDTLYLGTVNKTILIYKVSPEELTLQKTIANLEGWPNRIQLVNTAAFTSSSPYQYLKDME